MICKFDNRFSPAARYDLEYDFLDASGNGFDFNTFSGTAYFRRVYEGIVGLASSSLAYRATSDVVLRDTDDMTVQLLVVLRGTPSGTYILSFASSGETEPTNYIWSVQLTDSNRLAYFSEHLAGLDDAYFAAPANRGLPSIGVPFLLSMRRKNNVIQFFVDGVPFGDPSPVINTPTGGTSGQLTLNQGSSGVFDLFGIEINTRALTDAEIRETYDYTLGGEFGTLDPVTLSLWVGALTDTSASVIGRLAFAANNVRLALTGPGGTTYTPAVSVAHAEPVRFDLSSLSPDTAYSYQIEVGGVALGGTTGTFKTAPSGACSFTVAFSGDGFTKSNHASYHEIRALCPLLFLHMGDAHYRNIGTNDPKAFHAAFDEMLAQPRQNELFANIPTAYVFDDHDYGTNNSNSSSPSKPAACSVYRQRVPSHPLVEAGPSGSVYHTFDIGRVRFVVTDQRSAASPDSNTDNSSKSMLGTAQKTWFKNLLSNSAGKLIVWICPRTFDAGVTAGGDSWAGFTTERAELVSHIHTNCPGRVIVLSADMHALGIDDGSNHDFLPGGGEPLRVFQASPLDIPAPGGWGTYSEGLFAGNGQFGTMEISDSGGSSIGVTWKGRDSTGAILATHSFSVTL